MKSKFCQRCGRYSKAASLKRSCDGISYICNKCYSEEVSNYNKTISKEVYSDLNKSLENIENPIRMAKFSNGSNKLTKDEIEFLKTKYNHNSFVTGNKENGELRRIKEGLVKVKRPTPKTNLSSKSKNNKFLEGLIRK